jgi:hypothetical protein
LYEKLLKSQNNILYYLYNKLNTSKKQVTSESPVSYPGGVDTTLGDKITQPKAPKTVLLETLVDTIKKSVSEIKLASDKVGIDSEDCGVALALTTSGRMLYIRQV